MSLDFHEGEGSLSKKVELGAISTRGAKVKDYDCYDETRGGPRRIETSITVQSVENICTNTETVEVGMLLDVYWMPTASEIECDGTHGSSWDFAGNFQTVNAISDNERVVRKPPTLKRKDGKIKWYAQLWISAKFKQIFDLRKFPMDCQRLVVRFEMGNVKRMVYVPVDGQRTFCSVEKDLCPCSDWEWQGVSVVCAGTDPKLSKQGNSYSQMILVLHLARHWEPYFWRIGAFVSLLVISSISPFCLDPIEDYADRMGIVWTILLTQVAFQFTIQGNLPSEPYMSLLEIIIMCSIGFIFFVAVETSVIKAVDMKFDRDWASIDDGMMIFQIVCVVIFHVGGAMYCVHSRRMEKRAVDSSTSWIGTPEENIRVSASAISDTSAVGIPRRIYTSRTTGTH